LIFALFIFFTRGTRPRGAPPLSAGIGSSPFQMKWRVAI
jgi:hypothetical protein